MSLNAAFNMLLKLRGRTVTLKRLGASSFSFTVTVAPSNYTRFLEGPSDVTMPGREFVISYKELTALNVPKLRRGDRIVDTEMGEMTISEIREMFGLGSEIIGYRLRIA